MRLPNAAAEDVVAAGGGKVFVAVAPKDGGKIIRDSMGAHLAEVSEDPSAADIRYFLVNGNTMRDNKQFNELVRSGKLKNAGMYALSQTGGITRATAAPQLALFEKPDIPAPPPKEEPSPDRTRQAMILVSVIATFILLAWGLCGAILRKGCKQI